MNLYIHRTEHEWYQDAHNKPFSRTAMTPRIWGQCLRQGQVPRRENTRRPTLLHLHVMMTPLMIMIEMMDPNLALPDSWKKGKSLKECNEFQAAMVGDCFVNSFRPGSIVQNLCRFTELNWDKHHHLQQHIERIGQWSLLATSHCLLDVGTDGTRRLGYIDMARFVSRFGLQLEVLPITIGTCVSLDLHITKRIYQCHHLDSNHPRSTGIKVAQCGAHRSHTESKRQLMVGWHGRRVTFRIPGILLCEGGLV